MHVLGRLLLPSCLLLLLAGILAASGINSYKKLREPREFENVLFLDLDNCLYPRSSKFQEEFFRVIPGYYADRLGMSEVDAMQTYMRFRKQYFNSLRGLYAEHGSSETGGKFNVDDYIEYQDKNLDYSKIKVNHTLVNTLSEVKARLIVVTNSGIMHAERALKILQLYDLIEGIVFSDFHDRDYVSKPDPRVYQVAMGVASEGRDLSSLRFYFVDDEPKNVAQGIIAGWTCLLVQEGNDATATTIGSVPQIRDVWPELF